MGALNQATLVAGLVARAAASSRAAISQVIAAASNSSAKLLLPTNVSPEALLSEPSVLWGSCFTQSCEGCKTGTRLGQSFKSMGWFPPERGRRGRGVTSPQTCYACSSQLFLLTASKLSPLLSFLSSRSVFPPRALIQEQTTQCSSLPLMWHDEEPLGKGDSKAALLS